MSSYEQKEGDIAIFYQSKKTNEKAPDWTGKCLVDGQEKKISLWYKNDTMMTGKIQEPYNGGNGGVPVGRTDAVRSASRPPAPPQQDDDLEDDIPF
jgi:hypothetical protein